MKDNKYWLCFFSIVATVAIVLISVLYCNSIDKTRAITELVKGGADPLAAYCAIEGSGTQIDVCTLVANRK